MFFPVLLFIFFGNCFNNTEVTLVTYWFDVGLGEYRQRSNEAYFSYFQGWARVHNSLIVFCQDEKTRAEILSLRKRFHLENRTKVLIVEDVFSIERDMFNKMVQLSKDPYFLRFKVQNLAEVRAEYNYVTNLKSYFLYKAVLECDIKTDNVAWIDFGFNKGGWLYKSDDDFSFTLKCPIHGKISLFYKSPQIDERPMFEVIRTNQPDCITGGFFVCPKELVPTLWKIVRQSVFELLRAGLMDDDQPIFLHASRTQPDIFELRPSYWFLAVKQYCNGKHMRIDEKYLEPMSGYEEYMKIIEAERMAEVYALRKKRLTVGAIGFIIMSVILGIGLLILWKQWRKRKVID